LISSAHATAEQLPIRTYTTADSSGANAETSLKRTFSSALQKIGVAAGLAPATLIDLLHDTFASTD